MRRWVGSCQNRPCFVQPFKVTRVAAARAAATPRDDPSKYVLSISFFIKPSMLNGCMEVRAAARLQLPGLLLGAALLAPDCRRWGSRCAVLSPAAAAHGPLGHQGPPQAPASGGGRSWLCLAALLPDELAVFHAGRAANQPSSMRRPPPPPPTHPHPHPHHRHHPQGIIWGGKTEQYKRRGAHMAAALHLILASGRDLWIGALLGPPPVQRPHMQQTIAAPSRQPAPAASCSTPSPRPSPWQAPTRTASSTSRRPRRSAAR